MNKYLILILILVNCNFPNDKTKVTQKGLTQNSLKLENEIKNTQIFSITKNSVWIFEKGMTIAEAIKKIPNKQIKKKIGYGEFQDDKYDDYEIYDEKNNHILTLTPLKQNDPNATISRILIIDKRFKTISGISIESTYSQLINSFKEVEYSPDLGHIILFVKEIGVNFSIKKSHLENGWWDEENEKIDTSKIPLNAPFDEIFIFWN